MPHFRIRTGDNDPANASRFVIVIVAAVAVDLLEHIDRGHRQCELGLNALQRVPQGERSLEPPLRVRVERDLEHLPQALGHVAARERRDLSGPDPAGQVEARVAVPRQLEGAAPGQQRVEGRREREGVGCGTRLGRAAEGFRGRPGNRHATGCRLGVTAGGNAEVGQRRLAVLRHEDVRRLDVAVQDAHAVRTLDSTRDLHPERQHLWHAEAIGAVANPQVGVRAELHDDEGPAIAADRRRVNCDDCGVRRQLRHQIRFAAEARATALVTAVSNQDLDRDLPFRQLLIVKEDIRESA